MKKEKLILGAITGDIIGSVFEWNNVKTTDFDLFCDKSFFTDDTVMTVATMDTILNKKNYAETYKEYGKKYPGRGYGGQFSTWLKSNYLLPYHSFGNGSAMRVSPVGWMYKPEIKADISTLDEAKKSSEVTHNHKEGIKGAQAVAYAIYMSRAGRSKEQIKKFIGSKNDYGFHYDLDKKLDDIRPVYTFNETCQGSVPEAIIAFLESNNFEDAIRLAISIGGDSDTIACITGSIAEAYYIKIPNYIVENVLERLPQEFINVIEQFSKQYSTKE